MERCVRCIMPDTVPGVTLDEEGVCSLCRRYESPTYEGRKALDELVESIRGVGKKYDCIVPISGGRDSSFVLYFAAVELGLRVLAVNYNNEFRADQAVQNIRTACKMMNVDLIEIGSKRSIATKIVRNEIKFALSQGLPGIINVLCVACAFGYRSITYRAAEKHGVPLILWGSSQIEKSEDVAVKALDSVLKDSGKWRHRSRLSLLLDPTYWRLRWYHMLQRIEFHAKGNAIFFDRKVKLNSPNIREISLFDYVEWDRQQIKETIISKLGWRKPEGHVSTWRTDCQLHHVVNYCFVNPLGCSKACFGYSNMINEGQMTREEALAQEKVATGEFSEELKHLLTDRIGLTEGEVAEIESLQTVGS